MAAKKPDFYKIVKNVAIPNIRNPLNTNKTEMVKSMKVGDMFMIPADDWNSGGWYNRAVNNNMRIAIRKLNESSYGIWRIK